MAKYIVLRGPQTGPGKVLTKSLGRGSFSASPSRRTLSVTAEDATPAQADRLRREPGVMGVARAMPTTLIRPVDVASGSDGEGPAWGLDAVGALASAYTGKGVVAAILDTGIEAHHEAFASVTLEQKDFTGEGDGDRDGHGTHCAGTVFGREVAGRRIGVAPGIERALIGKVLGEKGGDTEMIVNALGWALDAGANVISMSLGIDFPGMVAELVDKEGWPKDLATSVALEAYRANLDLFTASMELLRARQAFGRSAVVIAASGNESRREQSVDYRIAASLPAATADVVSVGAVGRFGDDVLRVADFSNSAPKLAAPGVDVLSAALGGGLITMSGTSMACPHAAGVAALWWEKLSEGGSGVRAESVAARLIATSERNGLDAYDAVDYGEGLVKAP